MMIFQLLSELLFPRKCVLCQKLLNRNETDLCHKCRVESPEFPEKGVRLSFLDSWTSVWYYEGYIRDSILRYKFCRARHYAPVYGRMLAMKIRREYPDGFIVIIYRAAFNSSTRLVCSQGRESSVRPKCP